MSLNFELPPGVPLSQIPAAAPPAGLTSNLSNPPSLASAAIGVWTVMVALTLFFVGTRVYLAFQSKHKLALDEYCCVIAMVLSFSYIGLVLSQKETFRHSWDTPLSFYNEAFSKTLLSINLLLGPSMFFAKASLLLLYLRIFGSKTSTRYATYFGLVFSFCLYLTTIIIMVHYCAPTSGKPSDWTRSPIKCRKTILYAIIQSSLTVILDLFILILLIPVVLGLQMSSRKRIAVLAVFLTGILAVAASLVGLVYRVKVFYTIDGWYIAILYICVIIETNIAIICSCMPAFASFLRTCVAKSKYLVSLRDRIASYLGASKTKLVTKSKSFVQQKKSHTGDDRSDNFPGLCVGQYSELNDGPDASKVTPPRFLTKVHATPRGDLEEGLILESLSVQESAHEKRVANQL